MADTRHTHPRTTDPRVPVDLSGDGVLFMVNAVLFHPLGYALVFKPETCEFLLMGRGVERWRFAEDADSAGETADNDTKWAAFKALLARASSA